MGQAVTGSKNSLWPYLLLPVLSFGAGFGLAFQSGQGRALEACHMTAAYLAYTLELKDDMAVIDWSKDLQKSDNVLAFRATAGSKIVAEGGNRNLLSGPIPFGTHYLFPDLFLCHETIAKNPQNPADLLFIYRVVPSPLSGGFVAALASLLSLLALRWSTRTHPSTEKSTSPTVSPKLESAPQLVKAVPKPLSTQPDGPYLLLDRNFVVLQASPEAARVFGKEPSALSQSHLLDLSPDPLLMQAVEKAEEAELRTAFLAHPQVGIKLKPGPDGLFLFLKVTEGSKPPQNH